MSRKSGGVASLQKDAPWRQPSSNARPIPKIHQCRVLTIPQTLYTSHAISLMKHPNPIANGLAEEAIVEAAGPDCIIPGQITPVKLLGLKVWPIKVDLKFLERAQRELKLVGKCDMSFWDGSKWREQCLLMHKSTSALCNSKVTRKVHGKMLSISWTRHLQIVEA